MVEEPEVLLLLESGGVRVDDEDEVESSDDDDDDVDGELLVVPGYELLGVLELLPEPEDG